MTGAAPQPHAPRRRGIAVILVLTVLLALVLVGTPFVLSMLELERSGRTTLAEEEVEWVAQSARTAAAAWALQGTDAQERATPQWPWDSYLSDTPAEFGFDWRLLDPGLDPGAGRRAGILLADEQGKLPLRFASEEVVRLLATLTSPAPRDWKDLTTLYSLPESKWIGPYRLPQSPPDLRDDCGATVRIGRPGGDAVPQRWDAATAAAAEDPSYLELLLPPAVNLLTAPRDVLVAIFEPIVRLDGTAVGRRKAQLVAESIRERQPRDLDELSELLDALDALDPADRVAIFQNGLNPYTRAILSGTLPYTFASRDVVTADIVAILQGPSDLPRARRHVREVLAVASPLGTPWRISGPDDFDRYLRFWPAGDLVYLGPGLQLRPAQDLRGSARLFEHFDEEVEGVWLGEGDEMTYGPGDVLQPAGGGMHDVLAGGFEAWVRFPDPPTGAVLLDVREGGYSNRLSVEIVSDARGFALVVIAADASLPTLPGPPGRRLGGLSRYRVPIDLQADTWHHVGAYWKGTKLGHLAALVDGFSHPDVEFELADEQGRPYLTTLAADVAVDSMTISLADTRLLDPSRPTPLEIGGEVMVYDPATQFVTRGLRRTPVQAHPAGSRVSLFGYAQKVARANGTLGPLAWDLDRLTRGLGTLTGAFGTEIQAMVANEELLGDDRGAALGLDELTTEIEVKDAADITHFPPRGFLILGMVNVDVEEGRLQLRGQLNQEVVFYDGVQATGVQRGRFLNCVRGQLGTQARDWVTKIITPNEEVEVPVPAALYSIEVTDNTEYLDPTILQIDAEWFFVRKHPDLPTYWLGPVFDLGGMGTLFIPLTLVRKLIDTAAAGHAQDAKVIPVFFTRHTGLGPVNHWQAGDGDVVTILDGQGNREVAEIRHATAGPEDPPFNMQGLLVGFTDWVSREYLASDARARFLKWPSGELPSQEWLARAQPTVRVAAGPVQVDEIKFFAEDKGDFRAMAMLVPDAAGSIPFTSVASLPAAGGAVVVGEEVIGYARTDGSAGLGRVVRGYLRGRPRAHPAGERAFNLSGILPVAALAAPVDETAAALPVSQQVRANPQGYVCVGEEMIGYTAMGEGGLSMPTDFDGRGIYRGRFGTSPAPHDGEALVYFPPFRYRDTADEGGFFDPTMADFQAGRVLPGARWVDARLDVEGVEDAMEVWLDVRAGDRAAWYDAVAGARNGRFAFRGEPGPYRLEAPGDTFELRVAFAYRAGAFHPAHSWKRTPVLTGVAIRAQAPTLTLHHDEP